MKLNGNNHGGHSAPRKGKPSNSGENVPVPEAKERSHVHTTGEEMSARRASSGKKRRSKGAVIGAVLGAIVAVVALCVIVYALWEKPPERGSSGLVRPDVQTTDTTPEPGATATPEPTEDPNAGAPANLNENMYTFLVVGFDQVAYHTDTIMVGRLDTEKHEINVISIPRDTLMNIPGSTKKINELYLRSINNGGNGIDGTLEGITKILGFTPDVYAAVDLEAFVELIDAIGGVDYDVPVDMHYTDPSQGLVIDLDAGMQHLTGEQAVGVMRFRSGYATADIGRIGTQQDFLMSIASQFLSLGSIPHLGEFIEIFQEYVQTNMDASNLAFFARQFLMCKSEDIHFYTMDANYNDSIKGYSYVSINIDGWLEQVNNYLNPYDEPVTEANVDILTHSSSSGFYSTTGTIAGGVDSFMDFSQYR